MSNKKVLKQGGKDADIEIRFYSGGIVLIQKEEGERPHVISVNIDSLAELPEILKLNDSQPIGKGAEVTKSDITKQKLQDLLDRVTDEELCVYYDEWIKRRELPTTPTTDWGKVEVAIRDMPGISAVQAQEITTYLKQHIAPSVNWEAVRKILDNRTHHNDDTEKTIQALKQHIGAGDRVITGWECIEDAPFGVKKGAKAYKTDGGIGVSFNTGKGFFSIYTDDVLAKYPDNFKPLYTAPASEQVDWSEAWTKFNKKFPSAAGYSGFFYSWLTDNYKSLTRKNK